MAFLNEEQLKSCGFKHLGKKVLISDRCSIYGAKNITIGDYSRIDDFVVMSAGEAGIDIGCFVHIAVHSCLIGKAKITMEDFSGLSSRVSIYSSSDDYSGETLTNPTVPEQFLKINHAPVHLHQHVVVGSGAVILPGVTLEEGVAVGSLSLVTKSAKAFEIIAGSPARFIKERKRTLLEKEAQFREWLQHHDPHTT